MAKKSLLDDQNFFNKFFISFERVFTESMAEETKHLYEFGPLRLDATERSLSCDSQPKGEVAPLSTENIR